jgi:hypothetical protein
MASSGFVFQNGMGTADLGCAMDIASRYIA